MNKKVYIISIIIFVIGIVILIYSLLIKTNLDSNKVIEEITETVENQNIVSITNYSDDDNELKIAYFTVKKLSENEVTINYMLINNSNKKIINSLYQINMYHDNNLIYTHNYMINELNINDMIEIKSNFDVKYDQITKYESIYDGYKTIIKPN